MTVKETAQKDPASLIGRAYAFAERAHARQKRKNGEPFFTHPLATAETLAAWRLDEASIAAGLLHDVVEDTPTTREEIVTAFGEEIAFLVDGVTKLSHVKYRGAEARRRRGSPVEEAATKVENLRKMILALSQDLRVVFVKLADRLHNMKTLGALPSAKQKRIALETTEIYAPIAHRLGMHEVSGELQDLAFPFLFPIEERWLRKQVADEYEVRRAYLEKKLRPALEAVLQKIHIRPLAVDFRAKRYYSLYKKLLRYDMDLARIYDLVALRVILPTVADCYAVLGAIHQAWPPLPGRIKDYIAMPKENNYRSLHTTVIGPLGKNAEIQLRTQEMHEENEYGIAAHWLYKERGAGTQLSNNKVAEAMVWAEQIKNWQEQHRGIDMDPDDFLRAMKVEFFKDRVFAITPHGDVIDLPAGATPIDFAYHIHSDVGDTAVGVKVNGSLVPLDHLLQSGDLVEIVIQKGKRPSEDWLSFVKTSLAREHIRAALRKKSDSLRERHTPSKAELRIVALNRVDLIKDISTVISRSHVNIVSFRTSDPKGGRYPVAKIDVGTADKEKLDKLVLKLKKIPDVREVSYQLIS